MSFKMTLNMIISLNAAFTYVYKKPDNARTVKPLERIYKSVQFVSIYHRAACVCFAVFK